jgi:uncharacterized repeat protein (TIGR04076 family)
MRAGAYVLLPPPSTINSSSGSIHMPRHKIRCEAIDVKTESGICPGLAETQQGEVCTLGARTPEPQGICIQALTAIHPMAHAMKLTDRMDWEKEENQHFDTTCPHGYVTFRISRLREPDEWQ